MAFYIYPVMQVANILMSRAHLVPVGEDQLPHLDLTRETARRFNREFKPIFPEPEALLGRAPRLVGTDGNAKMGKSRGNTIDLKDSAETVAKKVRRMYGGPPRGAKEPGKVEENPIFLYLDAFDHDAAQVQNLKERYERTGVSSKELKDRLTTVLNELLEPCGNGARSTNRTCRWCGKHSNRARNAAAPSPEKRWRWYATRSTSTICETLMCSHASGLQRQDVRTTSAGKNRVDPLAQFG